jgi:hypothetical protein
MNSVNDVPTILPSLLVERGIKESQIQIKNFGGIDNTS